MFTYGQAVSGDNFTDRKAERARLKANFTHGINTIIISPRRLGKTSLVKTVISELETNSVLPIFLDLYDCRDEVDFYDKYSSAVIKGCSSTLDHALKNIAEFIGRITPKISVNPDSTTEYSLSLGLSPKQFSPEDILDLPEKLALKRGRRIVVCIDEFQQIGDFTQSVIFQKKLRSAWQHHKRVTYCFFGSKKHMMEKIFGDRNMPFYQFGELMNLGRISTADWVPFIKERFESGGKYISDGIAVRLCELVENYSSYVQQLAWNLYVVAANNATNDDLALARRDLLNQNDSFFIQQLRGLSAYQLNFLKAVCSGIHDGFTSSKVLSEWNIGAKSNVSVIKKSLLDNELIEERGKQIYLADPVFEMWLKERV